MEKKQENERKNRNIRCTLDEYSLVFYYIHASGKKLRARELQFTL